MKRSARLHAKATRSALWSILLFSVGVAGCVWLAMAFLSMPILTVPLLIVAMVSLTASACHARNAIRYACQHHDELQYERLRGIRHRI